MNSQTPVLQTETALENRRPLWRDFSLEQLTGPARPAWSDVPGHPLRGAWGYCPAIAKCSADCPALSSAHGMRLSSCGRGGDNPYVRRVALANIWCSSATLPRESDTPGGTGRLMSWAASKAVGHESMRRAEARLYENSNCPLLPAAISCSPILGNLLHVQT
jgi:hypothetical protein